RPAPLSPLQNHMNQLQRQVGNPAVAAFLQRQKSLTDNVAASAPMQRMLDVSKRATRDKAGHGRLRQDTIDEPVDIEMVLDETTLLLTSQTSRTRWAYDTTKGAAVPYEDWIGARRWPRWQGSSHEGGPMEPGQGLGTRTGTIPLELYKVVQLKDLASIAKEGLAPNPTRVLFSGMAAGSAGGSSPYWKRDTHLNATWLGLNASIGDEFATEGKKWAGIKVKVPQEFRDAYIRDLRDVKGEPGDEVEGDSRTVLAFAPIPVAYLWLDTDRLEELMAAAPAAVVKHFEKLKEAPQLSKTPMSALSQLAAGAK
ncbi:MAG: hypothetical protein M3273_03055, partial [Actinomycetota bacterium]|nr:hypothetical protein [Actinomycetota bacterium]